MEAAAPGPEESGGASRPTHAGQMSQRRAEDTHARLGDPRLPPDPSGGREGWEVVDAKSFQSCLTL